VDLPIGTGDPALSPLRWTVTAFTRVDMLTADGVEGELV
jgi:hypothetical protein